jgi:hypothetical protein
MEKKRGGWRALAAFGVLTLLGLYVGAYYATVTPTRIYAFTGASAIVPRFPSQIDDWVRWLFIPIHHLDRTRRPKTWNP